MAAEAAPRAETTRTGRSRSRTAEPAPRPGQGVVRAARPHRRHRGGELVNERPLPPMSDAGTPAGDSDSQPRDNRCPDRDFAGIVRSLLEGPGWLG